MKLAEENVQLIDIPTVSEIFADHIGLCTFEENLFRVELQVTRLNAPKPPKAPTGRRYPAARLVLPAATAIDLFNNLQRLVAVMEQQGLAKREAPASPTKQ